MNPIIWFSIIGASTLIVFVPHIISCKVKKKQEYQQLGGEPFVVSEYYARIEKAALDILEVQEPVDQTIILWWGLDGLRLNEDGSLEWISRRNQKPTAPDAAYQPCQSIQPASTLHPDFCQAQSTSEQIYARLAQNTSLQTQAAQNVLNAAIISQVRPQYMQSALASPLQQCCIQYPGQYPSYYYGGCCRLN